MCIYIYIYIYIYLCVCVCVRRSSNMFVYNVYNNELMCVWSLGYINTNPNHLIEQYSVILNYV